MHGWLPGVSTSARDESRTSEPTRPAAILPPLTTERIHAQRGRFTVHGSERRPLEDYFASSGDRARRRHLRRFVVRDPDRVCRELTMLGFARHNLFPELAELAATLRGRARG
jgi:hypothetical protein